MNCSNVIYKGEDAVLRFYIEDDYSNLVIKVYTDGKTMVTPSEITTEDGLITMYFHNDDLDILADGVLRYDVQYDVDGETVVRSICSDRYLKTPDGYSAMTAEEVYNQGYEAGVEAGASGDCSEAIAIAFQSGYTDGRIAGMTEQAIADTNRLTHLSATTNGTYTAPYGYSEVIVDVPSYLQEKSLTLSARSNTIITADSGYDGLSAVTIAVPLISSVNIEFSNFVSALTADDILRVEIGYQETNMHDFNVYAKRVYGLTSTYIDVYGCYDSEDKPFRIAITIPTTKYTSMGGIGVPKSFMINHAYGKSNGIMGNMAGTITARSNSDGTTTMWMLF